MGQSEFVWWWLDGLGLGRYELYLSAYRLERLVFVDLEKVEEVR